MDISNLEQMLDEIDKTAEDRDRISLGTIVETIGSRAFGPLLLMAGMIIVSPLSGIPGLPTVMGTLVLLIAMQLLIRRRHFWLPDWLLDRSLARNKLCRALGWLRPPARWIDRWIRPRLSFFIHGAGLYAIAILCVIIAASMPLLELIPFSSSVAGLALVAFGLALIARDGLLALVAFAATASSVGLILYKLI